MKKKSSMNKNKLDIILEMQRKQFIEQKKIEALEKKQLAEVREIDEEEHEVESLEKKQLDKLEELRNLEIKIKEKVGEHPLRKNLLLLKRHFPQSEYLLK